MFLRIKTLFIINLNIVCNTKVINTAFNVYIVFLGKVIFHFLK